MAKENDASNGKFSLSNAKQKLIGEGYRIIGDNSAVKTCLWTKHALQGKGGCWKEKFYGISSAGCCQMTPSLFSCENKCLHCWRNMDYTLSKPVESEEDPIEILDKIVEARKKLLMGFKGSKNVDLKKFEEALEPKLYTMSLSGEPTLYPRLGEMFEEIRRRKAVSFLVTNGLNPEVLENLARKEQLPTQITLSTNTSNEHLFNIWHRSTKKDAWKRFNQSLDVLKSLKGKVRRVVRLTLVKSGKGEFGDLSNMDESYIKQYALLIKKAEPDFIHVKGFMSVGFARKRMGYDKMPLHNEVKEYAKKLAIELKKEKYKILAESERSNVVMLGRNKKEMKIKKI